MIGDVRTYNLRRRQVLAACGLAALWPAAARAQAPQRDGARDFDFEFGSWTMHLRRRLQPLTGSDKWVEYDGTSVVHRLWGGAANVGEIDLSGPAGRIQGLTLRLYNPRSRQWSLSFANISGAPPGPPMIGGFADGRGEFYNQETLGERAIFVRFVFADITREAFGFEQAFSGDGGRTWEANWISSFKRVA